MKNKLYKNYLTRWQEVTELSPQTVGILTPLYKKAVPYLKVSPWKLVVPLSFVLAVVIALVMEASILQITSLLQKGF